MFNIYSSALKCANHRWVTKRFITTSIPAFCNKQAKSSSNTSLQDFKPIYKFPLIQHLGLVNRLKWYQSACTAIVVPTTYMLNALNIVGLDTSITATVIGLSGCCALFTVGYFTNKLIGFIYVNRNEDAVKIAYVDFWGRRQDIEIPKLDIIPICGDHLTTTEKIYYKLKRYSINETYVLNLSHCQVLDKERFRTIFGFVQ